MRHGFLNEAERSRLRAVATYKGVSYHKRAPGDFGLTPPAAPRPDKTLCDEAGVRQQSVASGLLDQAIDVGLVSKSTTAGGFPKQMWVVDEAGHVFEAMHGGDHDGQYHGYPIREADPFFDEVIRRWKQRDE